MTAPFNKACLDKPPQPLLLFALEGDVRHPVLKLDMQTGLIARRGTAVRMAFTLFLLCAFAVQGYLTQTHIHDVTQQELTLFLTGLEKADPSHADKQNPALPDEDDCPLCRLAAHTGSLVVPIVALALPVSFVVLPALLPPATFVFGQPVSHYWQVRAPPR